MKSEKNIKNNLFYMFIIITIIGLSIAGTTFFYYNYKVVQVNHIPIDFEVGDIIGLTIDTDALHFGRIPPGKDVMRKVNIQNQNDFSIKCNLDYSSDNIDWINLKESNFILNINESKEVPIWINVPHSAEYKNYTANLRIVMLRE